MILYHYCSNDEFYSIITNSAIWLSSLSLSSDSMEGKLVTSLISEMAKYDQFDAITIQRLQNYVSSLEKVIEGLGFCLSAEGDLLSQWRGYAEDASGVSIGFSKGYLDKLSEANRNPQIPGFTLQKVEYDRKLQEELIKPTYNKIKELINKGAFKMPLEPTILGLKSQQEIDAENEETKKTFSAFSITILQLLASLFLLKTKAFCEEREWRLISYLVKSPDDQCSFRPSLDKIIPYIICPLLDLKEDPILQVILGPKNKTPECFIDSFLKQNKFKNVSVIRSEASYR
ncbi:MAG: DUF2971 domain-containing protein [Candidatus Omnitrophica bacterium]|nr:DUF2971 domain-containing protein [Candidatus Omnitrophota bacterium]